MLWRVAEAFLNMLHALFGAPEEIAAKHTLTRHARGFLLSWIASAEALLRRLLIIEAAAFPKPEPRPRVRRRKHTRSAYAFDPDQPEAWRVGFRCFASPVRGPSFSARTPKSVKFPDLLIEPSVGAMSAGWFWASNGLNELADEDRFEDIVRRVNGGLTGYEQRIASLKTAQEATARFA